MATEYQFLDPDSGLVRLAGTLNPDPADNAATAYVTVIHTAPTDFVTSLMFDDTASTGGLYAWDGSAYVQVGLATS